MHTNLQERVNLKVKAWENLLNNSQEDSLVTDDNLTQFSILAQSILNNSEIKLVPFGTIVQIL